MRGRGARRRRWEGDGRWRQERELGGGAGRGTAAGEEGGEGGGEHGEARGGDEAGSGGRGG